MRLWMQTIDMDLKGIRVSPSVHEDEPQDLRRRSLRVAKTATTNPKRVVSPYFAKKPAVKSTVAVSAKREAGAAFHSTYQSFLFPCRNRSIKFKGQRDRNIVRTHLHGNPNKATESMYDGLSSSLFPRLLVDAAQSKSRFFLQGCDVPEQAVVVPSQIPVDNYRLLTADFYALDALDLAPRLLGKLLRHEDVILRITEVEAYRTGDTACHARFGQTARTEAMFRAGGHAYVFMCYGINVMLNVVADKAGVGAAVLIRACSPVAGLATILQRRKQSAVKPVLLTGPGKVGQALGLTTDWSCHPLFLPGGLEILDGPAPEAILAGPRVGIDYAAPHDVTAPWRFAVAGTPWVSAPRATLLPIQWSSDTILSDEL